MQVGKEKKAAVVFSCPGRHEELAGHPAAGATGKNLDTLLSLLSKALHRSDLARDNVTITNAWPGVEYPAKTGRSQATTKEVLAPENIERLQRELEEISEMVIFCGEKAAAAARHLLLKRQPKRLYIKHLGLRGLSLLGTDVQGETILAADVQVSAGGKTRIRGDNTERRLAVLVDSVLAQLRSGGKSS